MAPCNERGKLVSVSCRQWQPCPVLVTLDTKAPTDPTRNCLTKGRHQRHSRLIPALRIEGQFKDNIRDVERLEKCPGEMFWKDLTRSEARIRVKRSPFGAQFS